MSDSFLEYVLEQMSGLDGIVTRRMFGGVGIYRYGTMFAITMDDRLYFKVGMNNKADYQEAGSVPFIYNKRDKNGDSKVIATSYFEVPVHVLDNKDMLFHWLIKSHESATRDRKKEIV